MATIHPFHTCLARKTFVGSLSIVLLAGCASTQEAGSPEGREFMRAGSAGSGSASAEPVSGPPIRHLGVLMPPPDPAWRVAWVEGDGKPSGGHGAWVGFLTGLAFVQAVPAVLVFWPAAVGMVGGMTALGALGQQMENTAFARLDEDDRAALLQSATRLRPESLFREAVAEGLLRRTGRHPLSVPWQPTWGPDTPGTDPLDEARAQGAEGVLDLAVEAFGLAAAEEAETFGIFVRVRARLVEASGRRLRYERVLIHGPGRPLARLPRPTAHTLQFLAMDQARVFQHEMREVIVRMARIVAEDPALPLAER
jgi:hypothetical protein